MLLSLLIVIVGRGEEAFHDMLQSVTDVYFSLLSSGISMYSEREPGSSTGQQKQSVKLRNTELPVWAWRRWLISTNSLGVSSHETQEKKMF